MQIIISNKYGSLEIGGSNHPSARLLDYSGLGPPMKEPETVLFSGQPGETFISSRDASRTITLSFDFYGGQSEIESMYKMLYHEVDIHIISFDKRRKITGLCINPGEAEKIIYGKWYKLVLQFICYNPYFCDFYDTQISLAKRTDKFPNVYENGQWYIDLSISPVATERINKAGIYNRGDINVYPKIIINNIALSENENDVYGIEIVNETTGAFIIMEYNSTPGENITVDLPRRKIISDINGDITDTISDDTVLSSFYLQEGENLISTSNLSSSEEITAVIEFNNNYISAVI